MGDDGDLVQGSEAYGKIGGAAAGPWQLLLLAQSWEAWLAGDAKVERPTGCLASYGCKTINN